MSVYKQANIEKERVMSDAVLIAYAKDPTVSARIIERLKYNN